MQLFQLTNLFGCEVQILILQIYDIVILLTRCIGYFTQLSGNVLHTEQSLPCVCT